MSGDRITWGFLGRYPKYCTACRSYLQGVWKECPECKAPLVSSWRNYLTRILGKMCIAAAGFMLIIGMLCYGQAAERDVYLSSVKYFFKGNIGEAKKEFCRAFTLNPLYISAKNFIGSSSK
ncbi:MAG: hypothetical protein ABIA77_05010 [Candidatus Omnitrophota bacterium]